MTPDLDSPAPDLHAELSRRRGLGDAVAEEIETRHDGTPRPWFGVYRWEAVRTALGDDALSSRVYDEVMGLEGRYGAVLVGMDGLVHRQHRAAALPPFTRAAVADRVQASAGATIDRMVDELASRRSADLLSDLCAPLPAVVLTRFLGLPDADIGLVRDQAMVLAAAGPGPAEVVSDALLERLLPVIDQRRRQPTGDVISALTQGVVDGRPLADLEVFSHLRLLAIAGTDTVTRAIANLLFALLNHPRQMEAVRQDGRFVDAAVDEAVRWECPTVSVPRVALRDTRIGEVDIPRGSAVRCCLAAANRDPSRWPEPESFDLFRESKPSAGFGLGPHACLGVHLTRVVMARTVTTLLDRLPALELEPGGEPTEIVGADLRGPTHLRVRWVRG